LELTIHVQGLTKAWLNVDLKLTDVVTGRLSWSLQTVARTRTL